MFQKISWKRKVLLSFIGILGVFFLVFWINSPSHERDWISGHGVLPFADIGGEEIEIFNIRDFYPNEKKVLQPRYIDRAYDLNDIEGADFVLSRFSDNPAIAHTFITFRFKNQEPLAISIEARREKGEEYSPLKGLFQKYEMIYVVGTEQDLIGQRSHVRGERVYVFPGNTTPQKSRELFVHMMRSVNRIYEKPAFYNTLTRQCTTELAHHIRSVSDRSLPRSYKILFPGYGDQIAYDMGFLKNDIPLQELQERSFIQPDVIDIFDANFSQKIRSF